MKNKGEEPHRLGVNELVKVKAYEESHQIGSISIEQELKSGIVEGDFGVQIAEDGRVWICVDGKALIRFKPKGCE